MVRGVTITMVAGEPTLVFWRAKDFGKALVRPGSRGQSVPSSHGHAPVSNTEYRPTCHTAIE